jgi:long-chain fatty acid transport protein
MHQKVLASLSGCCLALLGAGVANATDAFNLIGHGPVSLGMGGTAAAYDIGPSAMIVNPATLALAPEGRYADVGFDLIAADLKIENTATGEVAHSHGHGANNGPYYAPELGFVWRRDRYALGVGAFAEGGVGTQYGGDSFLSRTATNSINTGLENFSRLLVLRIPVSAAYQVTDKLTVGGSLDVVWTAVNLGLLLDASQIGALAAQQRVSGSLTPTLLSVPALSAGYLTFSDHKIVGGGADAWGVGGELGLTYQVSPRTRLGAAYSFKTAVGDLSGRSNLVAVSGVAGNIPLGGRVWLRDFQMPAQVTVGVHHQLTDRVAVAADYQRVFWSGAMKDIRVGFAADGSGRTLNLTLPFNYRDTNVVSLGGEYRPDPRWTLRAGFHYAQEATPSPGLLVLIPSTPTTNLTGGAAYAFSKDDVVDLALSYGFPKSLANSSLPETDAPIRATHSQVAVAVAFRRRF